MQEVCAVQQHKMSFGRENERDEHAGASQHDRRGRRSSNAMRFFKERVI